MYKILIEERTKMNYTCRDMARMLNISPGFYWQVEHQTRRLTYDLAIQIAKVFHLKPDDLFY